MTDHEEREDLAVANGDQRDARGRFTPGNKAALGRGSYAQRFLFALRAAVTDEDVAAIAARAVEQAREGQEPARRFVFEYLVGRPRRVEATSSGVDLGELEDLRSVSRACARLARAVAVGEVDIEAARQTATLLELVRASLESARVEERLAEIEEQLAESGRSRFSNNR